MFTDRSDLFPETLAVQLVGGVPMTTSVEIATHFGKRHDTVLRGIKGLLNRTTNEVRRRNFASPPTSTGRANASPCTDLHPRWLCLRGGRLHRRRG